MRGSGDAGEDNRAGPGDEELLGDGATRHHARQQQQRLLKHVPPLPTVNELSVGLYDCQGDVVVVRDRQKEVAQVGKGPVKARQDLLSQVALG